MMPDYKSITKKMTIISVLMLFIVACVFFSYSNARSQDRGSSGASMTKSGNSGMKHYKSDDWNFSLDIPRNWVTSPSLPSYLSNAGELISFESNDNGLEALRISIDPYDPEQSLNEVRDRIEKQLTGAGYGNFNSTETTIGSRKALILDFDKKVQEGTLRVHEYLIPYHSILYALEFITTRPDASFKLYDRIAKTFEFHEPPVVKGIKKYLSPDGNIAMEIPANWRTMPSSKKYNELTRFGTPQNGVTAEIHNPEYSPWESLEDTRTKMQEGAAKSGWKDLTNSETVINGRKTLILDGNKGSMSARAYFFEVGDYKFLVIFYANTKNGIPADRLKVYERVMKSINIIKVKPEVAGMKEYAGPNLKKPIASGMKRYISPDGDYTVDVPGVWHSYANYTKYGVKVCEFKTSKNGLMAAFYPREYSPWISLEDVRTREQGVAKNFGFKYFTNSGTVINGRKTLILDSNIGSKSARNYFFEMGDYKYMVVFYANAKNGIPADRLKVYEQVMKSINILKHTKS